MEHGAKQSGDLIYSESLSSKKTEALFIALLVLFLCLLVWRLATARFDAMAIFFLILSLLFLFYSLNFRTLIIRLDSSSLVFKFGLFHWVVPLENIAACYLDELPLFMWMGGAGIHFMTIRGKYRVSFNFLEFPRVAVAFKRKVGPVREISFSTRRPDELLNLLQGADSAKSTVKANGHSPLLN